MSHTSHKACHPERSADTPDLACHGERSADTRACPRHPERSAEGAESKDLLPVLEDEHFRKRKKNGSAQLVDAPHLLTPLADSHAHVHLLDDPALALARAGAHQVEFIEVIVDAAEDGTQPLQQISGWVQDAQLKVRKMGSLCCGQAPYNVPHVRVAVGVHPHYAKDWTAGVRAVLVDALHDPRVSALGEIGLDYHYDFSPRDAQKRVFAEQVALAQEAGLPVVLHVREAFDDAYDLMQDAGWNPAGVLLHCYTSDAEEVRRWVEAGCFVAFGGALTFASSEAIREAITRVPVSKLLLETDAPYMAPVPLRGQKCEPAMVVFTADRALTELLGEGATQEERQRLLQTTYENTLALLDRPPTPWQEGERHA